MKHLLIILCLLFTAQLYAAEEAAKTLRGKVVLGDVKNTVGGALVAYQSNDTGHNTIDLKADKNGEFEIPIKEYPVYVEVMTPDKNFGKAMIVQQAESELIFSLELTASLHGKIIDNQTDKPSVGEVVLYQVPIPDKEGMYMTQIELATQTNEKGEYEFRNLPTGVEYSTIISAVFDYGDSLFPHYYGLDNRCKLQPGENRGKDGTVNSRPAGADVYSRQANIARIRSAETDDFIDWLLNTLVKHSHTEWLFKHVKKSGVIVILVRDKPEEPVSIALESIYVTLFDENDIFEQTARFYMMCVFMQPQEKEKESEGRITAVLAEEFVESHKIDLPLPSLFSFVFFDTDGKLRGVEPFDHTTPPAKQKEELIEMLKKY